MNNQLHFPPSGMILQGFCLSLLILVLQLNSHRDLQIYIKHRDATSIHSILS